MTEMPIQVVKELPAPLRPYFAPLLKLAFGAALGIVLAGLMFVVALHNAIRPIDNAIDFVWLLGRHFLPGYGPTITGALLGLPWGLALGFTAGWIVAWCRNRVIAAWVFFVAAKTRLQAGARFLDDM